jgi:hypothetical protein
MLARDEVIGYYQSQFKYFVRKTDAHINIGMRGKFAVMMSNDRYGRIVAISRFYKALTSVQREAMTLGVLIEPDLLKPVECSLNDCWRWRLVQVDASNYEWQESYDFNSYEELDQAFLDIQKVAAIDFVLGRTKRNSRSVTRYIPMQEKIYLHKYMEAKEIIRDYPDMMTDFDKKFPFVSGYADISGLDLQTAAKKVILQHETRASKLAEFENARIKYINKIKQQTDITELNNIIRAFTSEREY